MVFCVMRPANGTRNWSTFPIEELQSLHVYYFLGVLVLIVLRFMRVFFSFFFSLRLFSIWGSSSDLFRETIWFLPLSPSLSLSDCFFFGVLLCVLRWCVCLRERADATRWGRGGPRARLPERTAWHTPRRRRRPHGAAPDRTRRRMRAYFAATFF